MKLVTFGCSFVYGDELQPSTPKYLHQNNIGAVINKNYKFDDYINYGNNGASNDRIVLQILEYLNSKYYDFNDFIVVGLSGLPRNIKFLNIGKYPLTIPHWSYLDHIKPSNHFVNEDVECQKWMDLVFKFEINNKNDLVRYFLNISTIKSLILPFEKHLVFQSIDAPFKVYESVEKEKKWWNEIVVHHTYQNKEYKKQSNLFFDETFIKKIINENLNDSQIWINFLKESYQDFINKNDNYKFHGGHPTELGAQKYFEKVLKYHIDKILK